MKFKGFTIMLFALFPSSPSSWGIKSNAKTLFIVLMVSTLILGLSTQNVFAARLDNRVERRVDTRQNSADRVDDKQDTREERRDCTGEGADCRSDNRQDKRSDTVDRAEDRVDDRQDRR